MLIEALMECVYVFLFFVSPFVLEGIAKQIRKIVKRTKKVPRTKIHTLRGTTHKVY